MKPLKIQIFEGIPGSGKTTLRFNYALSSNFEDLQLDRFTPSQWVYGHLRGIDLTEQVLQVERAITKELDVYLIYMEVDPSQAAIRQIDKRDNYDSALMELIKAKDLYEKYLKEVCSYKKVIKINSSLHSVEEEIRILKRFMNI